MTDQANSERLTLEHVLADPELQRRMGVKPSPDGRTIEIDWQSPVWMVPATPEPAAERYPNLQKALAEGRLDGKNLPDPAKRELRCLLCGRFQP